MDSEENACNWCHARENACERGTIGFGGANFVNQSQSKVKQNQSKWDITFDTQLETAL